MDFIEVYYAVWTDSDNGTFMEYLKIRLTASFRLDARENHHLAHVFK
jgi:hypothetical protein